MLAVPNLRVLWRDAVGELLACQVELGAVREAIEVVRPGRSFAPQQLASEAILHDQPRNGALSPRRVVRSPRCGVRRRVTRPRRAQGLGELVRGVRGAAMSHARNGS